MPSFAGDLAAMISAVELGAARLQELVARYGADPVRAAINWNIADTERRFRSAVAEWPDGTYEAEVLIDHDTVGNRDVRVQVACSVAGDQLTVDFNGTDARPELVCVWNTFSNSRGYAMAQLASMVDPSIPKNEGLFDAVEMVIPEGSILQPPPGKPVALGAFHPAVECGEAICLALSQILPHRSSPQVYKLGMPPAVVGFDEDGARCGWIRGSTCARRMRRPPRASTVGARMCSGLGNLILASAEEAESRFPVRNLSREMTTDTGGAGRWRGQPGTENVKQVLEAVHRRRVDGVRCGTRCAVCAAETTRAPYRLPVPRRHARRARDRRTPSQAQLPADTVLAYQYGGGARLREPAFERDRGGGALEDVLDEYVSVEAARDRYGVVSFGQSSKHGDLSVDVEGDGPPSRRARRRAERRDELPRSASTSAERSPTSPSPAKGDEVVLEKTLSTPDGSFGSRHVEGLAAGWLRARRSSAAHFPVARRSAGARHDGGRQHPDRDERRGHRPAHHGRVSRRVGAAARLQGGHLGRPPRTSAGRSCRGGAG